ncbi:InlB B-repeat-containing protein [Anaerorhabdus furcosa]|uniref:Listeria/Bacterioides repeat-containing protein n=1 Tax=Anaerorhabdus furcosa TaxID=118967 RepID=A0A1T4QLF2_9FIRM|nr:InlB B-repeat-containing protein [Anaerorhabdus furcosa]SKA04098.1 Listeria/Bacterioides repeat-containing protein [Anaerorhabdus furcosa]
MRKKKIGSLCKKLSIAMLCICSINVCIDSEFISYIQGETIEIQSTFSETLSEDKKSSNIQLTIDPKENQLIETITLPDGTVIDETFMDKISDRKVQVTYVANENDTYKFVVDYVEMKALQNEESKSATVEENSSNDVVEDKNSPSYTKEEHQETLTYTVSGIERTEEKQKEETDTSETKDITSSPESRSDLLSLTTNKEGGWKWWVDNQTDMTAGNTHLQYTMKVMTDASGVSERTLKFALGNEDGGVFKIVEIAKDPTVIKSAVIASDNRSVELVINNSNIPTTGWTLDVIAMPEGKDVRKTYVKGNPVYGTYIGQKFYDNQTFGASASLTEGDKTITANIDFSLDLLYTETGGEESNDWILVNGLFTNMSDSVRSLSKLEVLMDGRLGYSGQKADGYLGVKTTELMHMPAGDVKQNIYTPAIYGTKLEMEAIDKSSATGVVGLQTKATCPISGASYYINMPADKQRPLAPGEYEADKNATIEWYQLKYDPITKTLSKVKKVIDYGKMKVTVPEFTIKNKVRFNEQATTVDATTNSIPLKYLTDGGLDACDYNNGTLTFIIPEHFNLEGLAGTNLYTSIKITYKDGSTAIVNTAEMSGVEKTNLSKLSDKKIVEIECKLTEKGIIGPFDKTVNIFPMSDIRQTLYGKFTDPDVTTDSRDEPEKNKIIIEGIFASEDKSITASGKINALFYDLGKPIDKPYISTTDTTLLFDSGKQSYNDSEASFQSIVLGFGKLKDLGSDGLTTSSQRYKNLDIILSPTIDPSNEAGDNQWKTIQSYMFNQAFGNIPGSKSLVYYKDAWIEYTLTGETSPRKIYISKNGTLQGTGTNFREIFPGYNAEKDIFLTSLKIHFEEVGIPSRLSATSLSSIFAIGYNMDRRWVSENPKYAGKTRIEASWTSTITYDGQTDEHVTISNYKYFVYGSSAIRTPDTNIQKVGVYTPTTATKGVFIPNDIKITMPFSVNKGSSQRALLDGKEYATPLPNGTKVYLKLNSTYFSYYGSTLASNPDSLVDLVKDKNGDSWLVYDMKGIIPSLQNGSDSFSVSIPSNTIRPNIAAKSGQQYNVFTEVYVDLQPLEQMSTDDNIGHTDYFYDTSITSLLKPDVWGIANDSNGLVPIKVKSSTQITTAAASQENLYILSGKNDNFLMEGIHWKANETKQLQANIQLGTTTKYYDEYELFVPIPQKDGTSVNVESSITKNNTFTMHVEKVNLPSGVTGSVKYYDTEDGTGTSSSTPDENTKSIRILLTEFTGNVEVGLELYTNEEQTYELADLSSSFITAKSSYKYYVVDDTTGNIDYTTLLSGTAQSKNFGEYTFNWYVLSGKIFVDNLSKIPDGLYNTGDTLYDKDTFTFKDLIDNKDYTAKVNLNNGEYRLRIQPKKTTYEIAPVIVDEAKYVLSVYTSSYANDDINTNFPRDYKNEGSKFTADTSGLSAENGIKDFMKANVGLYKQPTITSNIFPFRVKVGEELNATITSSIGSHFDKIEAIDGEMYGRFSSNKEVDVDNAQTIGKIKFEGTKETLDTDDKTSIYKSFEVTINNFFGEKVKKSGLYQVYKDPFVTFMRDVVIDGDTYTGTWESSENPLSKEIITKSSGDDSGKQIITNDLVPKVAFVGYTMSGWTLTRDGTLVKDKINDFTGIELEKYDILYPSWEANNYTIKYDKNTSSAMGTMEDSNHIYNAEKTLSKNNFSYQGYTFKGWSKSKAGTVDYTDEQSVKNLTSIKDKEVELYAVWEANSYDVEFIANGADGSSTMNNQSFVYDKAQPLTKNKFTKTGYTFIGWTLHADGTGLMYNDEALIKNLTTQAGGSVNLYAQWSIKKFSVTFDSNGGSTVDNLEDIPYDTKLASLTIPKKAGYDFEGWYKDDKLLQKWDFDADTITSNTTLYAKWKLKNYSVTYDSQGGSSVVAKTEVKYSDKGLLPSDPVKEGYTFKGWKYGDVVVISTMSYEDLVHDDSIMSIQLIAQWDINWYSVNFKFVGDNIPKDVTCPSSITVEHGTLIVQPNINTPANWTFNGWYKDKECKDKFDFMQPITSEISLYAKWEYEKTSVPETGTTPSDTNDAPMSNTSIKTPNKDTTMAPDEKTMEKELAVAVSRDIPLSVAKKGITDEILRQYITATTKNGAVGFSIVSHTVLAEVGNYKVIIRLDNGQELIVNVRVVEDSVENFEKPKYGNEHTCYIHWITLLLLAGYSFYSIVVIVKCRKENKELETALNKFEGN